MDTREKRTILIIDDDRQIRNLLHKSFEKAGYQVYLGENGRDGFAKAQEHLPTIILSDVMMPEMDGYQLCQALRQHPATREIPIILLTARGDTDSTVKGFQAGADEYIAKPFDIQEVLARVERVCRWMKQKQSSSRSTLHGTLDKTPLFELLRFCEEHRISGVLHLTRRNPAGNQLAPDIARVHLKLGEIAAIDYQQITDVTEALDRLLEWTEGTFTVEQAGLQLPGEDVSTFAEAPQASPPEQSTAAAHRIEALQQILTELQRESEGIQQAALIDAQGRLLSAAGKAHDASLTETFRRLIVHALQFSQQAGQSLDLGPLDEAILLSDAGLVLLYPVEGFGAMGVTTLKENQGMARWNCKEALDKIQEIIH